MVLSWLKFETFYIKICYMPRKWHKFMWSRPYYIAPLIIRCYTPITDKIPLRASDKNLILYVINKLKGYPSTAFHSTEFHGISANIKNKTCQRNILVYMSFSFLSCCPWFFF